MVDRFDAVVAMNPPSLAKFGDRVAPGGLLIVNTSLVDDAGSGRTDVDELPLPCTELAARGGDDKLVSVAALGALVGRLGLVSPDSVRRALQEVVGEKRPEVLEADLAVFTAGLESGTRVGEPALR